jgi:hypothetical protein
MKKETTCEKNIRILGERCIQTVTLLKEIHDEFHKQYGKKNTTYEMFLEFKNSYLNGDWSHV